MQGYFTFCRTSAEANLSVSSMYTLLSHLGDTDLSCPSSQKYNLAKSNFQLGKFKMPGAATMQGNMISHIAIASVKLHGTKKNKHY